MVLTGGSQDGVRWTQQRLGQCLKIGEGEGDLKHISSFKQDLYDNSTGSTDWDHCYHSHLHDIKEALLPQLYITLRQDIFSL